VTVWLDNPKWRTAVGKMMNLGLKKAKNEVGN
jgi:hypothetical protein